MITWKYVKPLKDEYSPEALAQTYGIKMPDDLLRCIKENNGGKVKPYTLDTPFAEDMVFGGLLSFNKEDIESVYVYLHRFKKGNTLTAFPFGRDPFGNIYCLKDGKIYFEDHESDELFFVSDTFTELLSMLR